MGYYVRAFCTSEVVPTLRSVLGHLRQRGIELEIADRGVDLDSNLWKRVALVYKKGKLPILVECNRDTSTDNLFREEVDEFIELIGNLEDSLTKKRVLDHLKTSKYIIACQLPTSDIDDAGYDANGTFLTYFVENHAAIIQADGEGFYEGNELIVELE